MELEIVYVSLRLRRRSDDFAQVLRVGWAQMAVRYASSESHRISGMLKPQYSATLRMDEGHCSVSCFAPFVRSSFPSRASGTQFMRFFQSARRGMFLLF